MSADSHETPRPLGEISQEPSAFDQFMDRNQKNLMILALVLVIAAAVFTIYRAVQKSHRHTAGAALSEADDLPSLQKIVKDYAETPAGGSARLLLAEKQWTDGQQDDAISTLRAFISEQSEHPALATAKASLASKLASQGKADEATKEFQEIVDGGESTRFLAPYALVCLGDLAKNAGKTDEARKFYERAQNEYPGTGYSNSASGRIALLGAKAPVEIGAPPAPTPAPGDASAPPANLFPAPGLTPAAPEAPAPSAPAPAPEAPAPETPAPAPAPESSAPAPEAPAPAKPE